MRMSLKRFLDEFSKQGCHLEGWDLSYDGLRLEVLSTKGSDFLDVRVSESNDEHTLTAKDWKVLRVTRRGIRGGRNSIEVR